MSFHLYKWGISSYQVPCKCKRAKLAFQTAFIEHNRYHTTLYTIVVGMCLIPWVSCWGDCCTPTLGLLHETAATERGTPYRWYRQHTYGVHQCPPSASTLYQVCFSLWCQSVAVPLSVRGRENMHISGTTLGQKLYIHLCRNWELWHLLLILIVLWF